MMATNITSNHCIIPANVLHNIIDLVDNYFDLAVLSGSIALRILAANYLNIDIVSGHVDFIISVDSCDFLKKTNIVMNDYISFYNNSVNIARFSNNKYIINIFNLRVSPKFEIIYNMKVVTAKYLHNEYCFYDENNDENHKYKLRVLKAIIESN
jgi:hypothetical protein